MNEELTLQELEELSRAYLDCRLSRAEEKELELLLLSTPISTPILREARNAMGIESLLAAVPAGHRRRRRYRWLLRAAACAAILVASAVMIHLARQPAAGGDYVCVVVDGHELAVDQAARAAAEIQRNSMAMLAEAMQEASADQTASLSTMNEIIHNR
ncbi:MAG: hypothetical protein HDS72_08560 [Bacteroidales bacterium]|nr:hypothetical protein [Bacteroidales bacterium]